jgi:hypothetical protein
MLADLASTGGPELDFRLPGGEFQYEPSLPELELETHPTAAPAARSTLL